MKQPTKRFATCQSIASICETNSFCIQQTINVDRLNNVYYGCAIVVIGKSVVSKSCGVMRHQAVGGFVFVFGEC